MPNQNQNDISSRNSKTFDVSETTPRFKENDDVDAFLTMVLMGQQPHENGQSSGFLISRSIIKTFSMGWNYVKRKDIVSQASQSQASKTRRFRNYSS